MAAGIALDFTVTEKVVILGISKTVALQDTKNNPVERIIMGVDPGTLVMGFGIIKITGKKVVPLLADHLLLSKYDSHALRLKKIFERALGLIDEYLPDEMALEAPFYGKNIQSMLKLGRAQGVVMAAALSRDVPVVEYSPRKVKMAITGNGNASKEQVAAMVARLLDLKAYPFKLDETDALAVALCHYYNKNISGEKKSYSGWKAFIKNNPGRVK